MKQTILKHQSMGVDGKFLLRSIQNDNLPALDLLVRECIQNSLDASLSENPGNKVRVDFIIKNCDCRPLNKIFEGITGELNRRYREENVDFIAVKDTHTTGLTGPLRECDVTEAGQFGNLRKLIYEFGQCQENAGKGGSWGIGKTVCFRVGIGIVLYYSRIRLEDGTYQERLAAALVENASAPHTLMTYQERSGAPTGICWWGSVDPDDGTSMPVTNEKEIHPVIDIFGIPPYEGEETGTCIIIPYIDKYKLLKNADPEFEKHGEKLESIVKLIAQRWYFPRLQNKEYLFGCWLDFRVNGMPVKQSETCQFFKEMQTLYNLSAKKIKNSQFVLPDGINSDDITLRNEFSDGSKAGIVVWTQVTAAGLNMTPPENTLAPYILINKPDEDVALGNPAIIAYCRHAGMIIDYEVRSAWTQGIPAQPEGTYLLAFFQPNGNNILKDETITLDEYLRSSENADHHSWEDRNNDNKVRRIIEKIIRQIPKKITTALAKDDGSKERNNNKGLQRILGKQFLPPSGYGKRPGGTHGRSPAGGTREPSAREILLNVSDPVFGDHYVQTGYQLFLKKGTQKALIYIKVHTSSSAMNASEWEQYFGKPFPVTMISCTAVCGQQTVPVVLKNASDGTAVYGAELDLSTCSQTGRLHIEGQIRFQYHDEAVSISILAQKR